MLPLVTAAVIWGDVNAASGFTSMNRLALALPSVVARSVLTPPRETVTGCPFPPTSGHQL